MSKWWQSSTPGGRIEPKPWLAPQAIQHLENIIQPDFEVLEHGSGGSTLWFAERVKEVYAVEQDPDWQAVVRKQAPGNVTVWGKVDPEGVRTNFVFDLLLIDGEPVEDRRKWLTAAPQLVKPGGWVVLDNANRPEYEAARAHLREIAESYTTIDGNEKINDKLPPEGNMTRYLVTDFFRLKGATDEDRTESQPAEQGRRHRKGRAGRRNASA